MIIYAPVYMCKTCYKMSFIDKMGGFLYQDGSIEKKKEWRKATYRYKFQFKRGGCK